MIDMTSVHQGTNHENTLSPHERESGPSRAILAPDSSVQSLLREEAPPYERGALLGKNTALGSVNRNSALEGCVAKVKEALIDGSWTERKDFAGGDLLLMPDLVQMANERKPGLGLVYLAAPDTLGALIERDGVGTSGTRYIVNVGHCRTHFAVIDCRVLQGHTSVILFEPADLTGAAQRMLAQYAEQSVRAECSPDTCHFLHVEMDIQRSNSECGIFSLALGKKLHKEYEALTTLHQLNVSGSFRHERYLSPDDADQYLPPSFYKHAQGRKRIAKYLESNPQAGQALVNKKQQTLLERFKGNLDEVGGRLLSRSIHDKRLTELSSLEGYFRASRDSALA